MAEVYYTVRQGWFCDSAFRRIDVRLKKRFIVDPNSPIQILPEVKELVFTGHDEEPVLIQFDQGSVNNKLNAINGSQCIVNLMAVEGFELSDLYTSDEKEWMIEVDIEGLLEWNGFLLPDDCKEPFKAKPYPVQISATDALGTLDEIPFSMDDGTLYRGMMSDLAVLRICLEKTGLSLPYTIGVNTSVIGPRGATNPDVCLLAQTFIDVSRFIDEDAIPFSCKEVLRSIIERHSSRLHQVNGRWQVINVLELSFGTVKGWLFDGNLNPNGTSEVVSQITAGGLNREVIPDGDSVIGTTPAYLNSTAYYQYGYPTNKLKNGNMDVWTSKPNGLPDGWSIVGNINAIGKVRQVNGQDTTDYFIEISGQGDGYVQDDNTVLIRAGEKSIISFDLYAPDVSNNSGLWSLKAKLSVIIKSDDGSYYSNTGWKGGFASYDIEYTVRDFINQVRVSFEVLPRATDYQLTYGTKNISTAINVNLDTWINNVDIQQKQENELTKISLGEYNRQTSLAKQSLKPDPILLLHSSDTEEDRTSRMSIVTDDPINVPIQWSRANLPGENKELLQIVANTQLRLHSRPYRIFEANFHGVANIDPNTVLTTDLLPGKYMFLSGTFDLKTNIHNLRFAEILTDDIPYTEEQRQDYGNENDKNGIDVANPIGVPNIGTIPFNPANFATPAEIPREATELEARAGILTGVYMSPSRNEDWWDAKRSQDVNIIGNWTFNGQSFATSASNVETQVGVVNDKYVSPSTLANWWSWLKTTAQTVTALWNFSTRPTFNGVGLITAADIPKGSDAVLSKSANYTVLMSDFGSNGSATIYVDTTASGVAITLPTATQMNGYTVNVIKVSADVNSVNIIGTINGVVNDILANQYDAVTYKSNGTSIFIF